MKCTTKFEPLKCQDRQEIHELNRQGAKTPGKAHQYSNRQDAGRNERKGFSYADI
jgi:hypothetical protein